MLEVLDLLTVDPEKADKMRYFAMKRVHSKLFEQIESVVTHKPDKSFVTAMNSLIDLRLDEMIAGISFLVSGSMVVHAMPSSPNGARFR